MYIEPLSPSRVLVNWRYNQRLRKVTMQLGIVIRGAKGCMTMMFELHISLYTMRDKIAFKSKLSIHRKAFPRSLFDNWYMCVHGDRKTTKDLWQSFGLKVKVLGTS